MYANSYKCKKTKLKLRCVEMAVEVKVSNIIEYSTMLYNFITSHLTSSNPPVGVVGKELFSES